MDDIFLRDIDPDELQQLRTELDTASNEVRLKLNLAKTKVIYDDLIDFQDIKSRIQYWN